MYLTMIELTFHGRCCVCCDVVLFDWTNYVKN